VDVVNIGSPSDHLRLSTEPDDPARDYLMADLAVDGLRATTRVYAHYASWWRELVDFFAGLAADWRGWSGTREWASLGSELTIQARHQFGHVQLRVTVRRDLPDGGNHGWTASADITLEPGEQLSRVTADVWDL
jgi:hypothetical protein